MTGSPASASNKTSSPVLVCGLNWIGDSIMAMPALQAWRAAHPHAEHVVLVKPALAPLWRLHRAPSRIELLEPGNAGTLRTGHRLAGESFQAAYILPNSFRSALVPWLARVPRRRGPGTPLRRALLTEPTPPPPPQRHQAWEYFDTFDLPSPASLPAPELEIPPEARDRAAELLAPLPSPRFALIPGAARGPSKQWPAEHYIALGRLVAGQGGGIAVTGAPGEAALCEHIASEIGTSAISLAGRTSFTEWAALLQHCGNVVANDSGGMHLAAAVGARTVAVYGATDPAITGPLGTRCTVIQTPGPRARDLPRVSPEAQARLAAIKPEEVFCHLTAQFAPNACV